MLNLFAGDIYSEEQVQTMFIVAIFGLIILGIAIGTIIYIVSRIAHKLKHQDGVKSLSLIKSLIIGLISAGLVGVIFYFAS